MSTKIILTRHGHVEGIRPRRFRGRADVSLTGLGVDQAKATAKRIASSWRPNAIYTSPMQRCVATAVAIAEECKVSSTVLDNLIDLDHGEWQWKTHEEIGKAFPDQYAAWRTTPHRFRFPGGDSLQDLVSRTGEVLRYVLQQHAGQTVVLVGHNSVNRALFMQILDQPLSAYWRLDFAPCGLSEVQFSDSGMPPMQWIKVLCINDTSHLAGLAGTGEQRTDEFTEATSC